ncbi:MAG: hypothetical protein PUI16_07655 [Clostridia bacterium]|nr:hypothetical protein [Clostridia bacterium]MDY5555483.1 hypothetical protein [Blautia sp.]
MSGINIQELGINYVGACAREYWGDCLFLLIFTVVLLGGMFISRKQESGFFLWYTVFLCLTVFNPVLVKYVIPRIGFEHEYYRFFWLLPVMPAIAYYIIRLIYSQKKKLGKVIIAALSACIIIFSGAPMDGVVKNFSLAENIYKVPDDLRAVCSVIHQHSNKENPRVVFDQEMNFVVRQYDPSIFLSLNRDAILYRAGSEVVSVKPESSGYKAQKVIMDALFYNLDVDSNLFLKALNDRKADYLVLPLNNPKLDFLKECGCVPVAQTEERIVFFYEREKE